MYKTCSELPFQAPNKIAKLTPDVVEKWNFEFHQSVAHLNIMENLISNNPQLETPVDSGPLVVVDSMIHVSLSFISFAYLFKNDFFPDFGVNS